MKRSIWIIILVVLGIVVASPPLLRAHDGHDCDITGAWVGNSPPIPGLYTIPVLGTQTITPTDPTGKRFHGVIQPLNPPFSLTDFAPDTIGTYVRSGRGSFQFTWISYGVHANYPERSQITGFWTFSGTVECTGADTLTLNGMVSFYDISQDSNGDGLPDVGAVPYFRAPWGWTLNRLPLMAP